MSMQDRPAALPRRSAPRPSPTEDVDPIDSAAAAPRSTPRPAADPVEAAPVTPVAPAVPGAPTMVISGSPGAGLSQKRPSAPRAPRAREVVVQLNTKISLDAREQLDLITQRDGSTLRAAIETAIADLVAKKKK